MDSNNMYNNNNQGAPNSYQPGVDYSQPYNQQGGQPGGQPGYNPLGTKYTNPNSGLEKPLSVGDWIVTLLITMIPCLGIVMIFVWAFGSGENKSKSNFFKAQLIFMGVVLIFCLIMFAIFWASFLTMFSQSGYGQY